MSIEQLDPQTLIDAMATGDVLLIDVRELNEYTEARIPGAVLVPMSQCAPAGLPCNPDKVIVFHCKKGGRSQKVAQAFIAAFPDRTVYNLAGGIDAWIAGGHPIQQS